MARFRDEWTDPTDLSNGINRGQQWSPLSDNFSVYDANKIVNNLIHLKNRITDGTGTIIKLGGESQASMEVDSTPQESGTNRLVTSAGVANALKNFTPSDDNKYDDTELRGLINGKVDKVDGKQLSTNDFTNEDKAKLDGLSNYNDTELRGLINNKANLDASNLSTTDVDKWKSKLGVPSSSLSLLDCYPIGSIYITTITTTTGAVSPASFLGGTWERLPEGYALWTASSGAGNTISAGLPNVTGQITAAAYGTGSASGAFTGTANGGAYTSTANLSDANRRLVNFNFNAARSSGVYGASSTVQPPAYKVYAWKRTA